MFFSSSFIASADASELNLSVTPSV